MSAIRSIYVSMRFNETSRYKSYADIVTIMHVDTIYMHARDKTMPRYNLYTNCFTYFNLL